MKLIEEAKLVIADIERQTPRPELVVLRGLVAEVESQEASRRVVLGLLSEQKAIQQKLQEEVDHLRLKNRRLAEDMARTEPRGMDCELRAKLEAQARDIHQLHGLMVRGRDMLCDLAARTDVLLGRHEGPKGVNAVWAPEPHGTDGLCGSARAL